MSRLGCSHGYGYGLEVTHLSKQYDMRALTQSSSEPRHVTYGIHADLSLAYYTLIMSVQILYRVLQRDHVRFLRLVDMVNDARQSRRLT